MKKHTKTMQYQSGRETVRRMQSYVGHFERAFKRVSQSTSSTVSRKTRAHFVCWSLIVLLEPYVAFDAVGPRCCSLQLSSSSYGLRYSAQLRRLQERLEHASPVESTLTDFSYRYESRLSNMLDHIIHNSLPRMGLYRWDYNTLHIRLVHIR